MLPQKIIVKKNSPQILLMHELHDATVIFEEGAKLTFIVCATEGWEDRKKLVFEFLGRGSELTFLAFIVGKKQDRFAFETLSRHTVPETKAHYFVRAAMFDQSLVDYKGNLVIEKEAPLTDAYLAHHTLLLSPEARAKTVPCLEIEADDVKAGHSASIGKVDEELLFYLQSRGIDFERAQQILISGFFEQQFTLLQDQHTRDNVRQMVFNALPLQYTSSFSSHARS